MDHFYRLADQRRIRRGFLHGDGLIGIDVKIEFSFLYIQGKLQQHGAGAAGTHEPERFTHDLGQLAGFFQTPGFLGDRFDDIGHVDALERLLLQLAHIGLADNAQHGHGIDEGGIQACDKIGGARAG